MTFINKRLSKKVALGFTGGPMWDTTIVPNAGGFEARIANWSMPLYKYTADYSVLDPASQNEIAMCFNAARGQRDSFRFKDWGDYIAKGQALGTGDGTNTPRQLCKYYDFDGASAFGRNILLPVASTVVVTDNGSPFAVTVNDQTGMVAPATGNWISGHVYLASFEFDVRVRFASDHYPFTLALKGLAQVSIDLVEARTP